MAKTKVKAEVEQIEETTPEPKVELTAADLAATIVAAMQAVKPIEKKTPFTRVAKTPWTPKDGSKKLKLTRKVYQHSRSVGEYITSNEEIALCNKIRPGVYMDGFVKVIRRRDKGIDIDYPIGTASQKLKLVNQFGIRNFKELLERIVEEGLNPKKVEVDNED